MKYFHSFVLLLSLSPPPPPFLLRVAVRFPAPEEQGSKSSREVGICFFAFESSSRGSAHEEHKNVRLCDVPFVSSYPTTIGASTKTVALRETQEMTKTTSSQGSLVRFRSARDVPDTSVLNGRVPGVKTIVTAGADDNQNSG